MGLLLSCYNMLMIVILIGLLALLIIVIRNRRARELGELKDDQDARTYQRDKEIRAINEEILAELAKPEPDYEKLKTLRAKIDKVKDAELEQPKQAIVSDETATAKGRKAAESTVNGLTAALYAGSLLVLAGAGGLVFTGAKEIGLMLLVLMTVVFYGGGLLIRNNDTLKQASYVFVGTGMMMMPFLGFLIQDVTKMDPSMLWFVMSAIGVPMYLYATYIMQNQVFAYFALAGFVSLSCSMASVMGLALVWYYVFVMIIGILFNIITMTGYGEKLGVMKDAVRRAGEWLPIATLFASFAAAYNLKEVDYVIILGVAVLHITVDYIVKPGIASENILRMFFPAWIVLLMHFLSPSMTTIGIALGSVTIAQIGFVFYNVLRGIEREQYRKETEKAWTIVSLISFVVAGAAIGNGVLQSVWTWVSVALVIDTFILVVSRYVYKNDAWYVGLIATGIALPLTIIQSTGATIDNVSLVYTALYLLEMIVYAGLFWQNTDINGDTMTALGVGVFGIAALISGWSEHLQAIVLLMVAACYFMRGFYRENNQLKEIAVYCAAMGAYFILDWLNGHKMWNDFRIDVVLIAHLLAGGLIVSNYLWGTKTAPFKRILIAAFIVMMAVGGTAIGGASWAMYMFLFEVVMILMAGLFLKDNPVRNTGIVGIFLAVLWFTRNLSFVWPIILGLGIIGTVVFMLLNNGKKMPPKLQ